MASPTLDLLARLVPNATTPLYSRQTPDPDRIPRIAQAAAYRDRTYYCIAAFVGIVSIFNWTSWLLQGRLSSSRKEPRSRGAVSLKRLPAALMNAFRALAFRQTLRIGSLYTINVSEFALTAGYITLVFTLSMMNSTNLEGVAYDAKYWANTAGSIASTQLSFMVALGMKNNIISFLTGISFDKLNDLHRMTARVLCVLIWVHAGGRAKLGLIDANSPSHAWLQCGLLAASSLTVLSIVSLRPIRERNYELFLLIHFLLAFIILLAAYFHTEGGSELGQYVWPAFVVWGTDRVLRGVRIVVFNFGNFIRKGAAELNAHVDIISPRFLRIRLQRPTHLRWAPGQSVYLTLPSVSTFPLEAHPFTISTVHSVPEMDEEVLGIDEKESNSSPPSSLVRSQESSSRMKQLVFLVRVRSGFSQRLLQAAESDKSFTAFLDGPYSSPPLLRGFETVILIAGGSGVAFTLPLLLDLVHRSAKNPSSIQRIVFVWAIRDIGHVEWISDALVPVMRKVPASISLEVRLAVTGVIESQSRDDDSAKEDPEIKIVGKTKTDIQLLGMPRVHIQRGRPDVKLLMQEEINRAAGDISVNVCGSHGLASTVRSSLSSPRFLDVLKGGPSVTLHVESA
ncbi:iron reductase [Collybia nuda]|uniref:Iron reductase n=1 Tax=Collybia nuda TaxID=64659 RepID=A0A9P6CL94_9AGAR|nr:iron reductase [Collybia nuda]